MATIAHLSGLAGYVIPFGGVVVPIVLWITNRRSPVIAALARQAVLLNLLVFVAIPLLGFGLMVLLVNSGGFSPSTPVGSLLVALGLIVAVLALAAMALLLPIMGAVKASQGEYYRYPIVGASPQIESH